MANVFGILATKQTRLKRSEILTDVLTYILDVTQCRLVNIYRRFEGPLYLLLQGRAAQDVLGFFWALNENNSRAFHRNVDKHQPKWRNIQKDSNLLTKTS